MWEGLVVVKESIDSTDRRSSTVVKWLVIIILL